MRCIHTHARARADAPYMHVRRIGVRRTRMMIRSQFPCSRFVCFGVVGRRERIWIGMAAHLLHLVTALAFLNLDVVPTTEITAGARRYGFPSGKYTPTKHGCKLSQLPVHGDALLHIEVPFSWTWPFLPGTDWICVYQCCFASEHRLAFENTCL